MAIDAETQRYLDGIDAAIEKSKGTRARLKAQEALVKQGVKRMEKGMELLLNLAGGELKELALAEGRRADFGTKLLDVDAQLDAMDSEMDEPERRTR